MRTRGVVCALMLCFVLSGFTACGDAEKPAPPVPEAEGSPNESMAGLQPGDLRPGDVLVSVDGKPVSSREEALQALRQARPGESVRLEIDREGSRITLEVASPR